MAQPGKAYGQEGRHTALAHPSLAAADGDDMLETAPRGDRHGTGSGVLIAGALAGAPLALVIAHELHLFLLKGDLLSLIHI